MALPGLAAFPDQQGGVRLTKVPTPDRAGYGEVLVRMLHAPINPADLLVIDDRYSVALGHGAILGAEGVGVVQAVGPGVADLAHGQMVLPLTRGNWQSHRLLDRADLVAVPPDLHVSPQQAAMLRINPATARLLLRATGAGPGDAIVQNAAGSAVGQWVRWFAAQADVAVIDVVRNPQDRLPGAITDAPDLAARVRSAAGGRPLRAALDCVAGSASGRLAECLSPGGRLMVFGHLSGEPVTIRSQVLTGGGLAVCGFSLRPAEAELGAAGVRLLFDALFERLRDFPPDLPVHSCLPFTRIDAAIAVARAGQVGRVLINLAA